MGEVADLIKRIESLQTKKELLTSQLEEAKAKQLEYEKGYEAATQAREVVKKVAAMTRGKLEYKFANIISTALAAVLNEPYEFGIAFEERRNTIECDFYLTKNGERYGITDTVGGGVIDIISFALRIAYWSLKKTSPVFVLDEPFKFLSIQYHEKASEMMKLLSEKLGLQFIMVSHLEKMVGKADKVFTITKGKVDVKPINGTV